MYYRTKTYIAADWEHDIIAVEALNFWNENSKYGLSFLNAHDLKQARDSSLNCSIKKSLADRLNKSKTFILIVGDYTNNLRAGGCQYCKNYNSRKVSCANWYNIDYRSYIEFECEKAVNDDLKIVVLYNSTKVDREKCPEIVRYIGTHIAMLKYDYSWDYQAIKNAII